MKKVVEYQRFHFGYHITLFPGRNFWILIDDTCAMHQARIAQKVA